MDWYHEEPPWENEPPNGEIGISCITVKELDGKAALFIHGDALVAQSVISFLGHKAATSQDIIRLMGTLSENIRIIDLGG